MSASREEHSVANRVRLTVTLILALATLACGKDATAPDDVSGTWVMVRIHGQAVPAFLTSPGVPGVDGYRTEYIASTVVIRSNDTYTYTLHKRMEWPHNVWKDVHQEVTGTLSRPPFGGAPHVHFQLRQLQTLPNGQTMNTFFGSAELRADGTLVLVAETGDMEYQR
jgi:hypothetical protein